MKKTTLSAVFGPLSAIFGLVSIVAFVLAMATTPTACKTGQTPWQNVVTDVTTIVDCTKSTCAVEGPTCAAIEAEVLSCIPAIMAGNPLTCAALANGANAQLALADIVCVLDAFSNPASALGQRVMATPGTANIPAAQAAAAKWIADQHIGVIRVK